MRNMWLCPVRRMWTPGGRCAGCAGRPAPLSFLVRIWSYTLGVTHLVTPWSQKQLREIVRNLSVYFISQGPRIFHPASMFCLTRGLLKIHEPRPPWILGFSEGRDFSGCHFATFTRTQNNNNNKKEKTGWRITYSVFAGGYFGLALCREFYSYHLTSLSLLQLIISILWMRKRRLREIKNLIQVLQSGKWLS